MAESLIDAARHVRDLLFHPTRSVDGLAAGRLDDAIKEYEAGEASKMPANASAAAETHSEPVSTAESVERAKTEPTVGAEAKLMESLNGYLFSATDTMERLFAAGCYVDAVKVLRTTFAKEYVGIVQYLYRRDGVWPGHFPRTDEEMAKVKETYGSMEKVFTEIQALADKLAVTSADATLVSAVLGTKA